MTSPGTDPNVRYHEDVVNKATAFRDVGGILAGVVIAPQRAYRVLKQGLGWTTPEPEFANR